jgi:hypothetical protein
VGCRDDDGSDAFAAMKAQIEAEGSVLVKDTAGPRL